MRLLGKVSVLAAAMIAGQPAFALDTKNPNTVPTRAKLFIVCNGGSDTSSETEPSLACAGENSVGSVTKAGPKGAAVSAFASSPGSTSGETYRADAALTYSFVIWGGYVGDIVPLKIDYVLSQDSSGPYQGVHAEAQIAVFDPGGSQVGVRKICTIGCAGSGGDANEYAGTLNISTRAGSQYVVNIYAEARATAWGLNTFATASVDPYIYVDPSFADAATYSVAVSEGVANLDPALAAVPEPASWAMMIGGLGLVGASIRHRRTAVLFA